MAKPSGKIPLRSSLLDRLVLGGTSGRHGYGQGLREIKEGIRKDLEDLLNTRWRAAPWPENLTELETSLVNYGIPDFTGANLGSPDRQEEFRQVILETIERYEPRLRNVRVKLTKNPEALDRILRFRIEATLIIDQVPEPVVFDSDMEPLSASFVIKEGSR